MSTDASCQPIGTPDSDGLPFFDSKDQYNRCNCNDLCSLLSPKAPLRDGTSMVPILSYSTTSNILFGKSGIADRLATIETALFSLWIFACIQGIFALLGSGSTQDVIRNRIFKALYGDFYTVVCFFFKGERRRRLLQDYYITAPDKTTVYWTLRRYIAKLIAGFVYVLRLFAVVIYPILFIASLAFCELLASDMPVSEPSSALGAWSAWVGAALIVLSAIILAIFPSLHRRYVRLKLWIEYDAIDRPHDEAMTAAVSHTGMMDFKQHLIFNVLHFFWKQNQTRLHFLAWWKDPVTHSYPEKYELDGNSTLEPECGCKGCKFTADPPPEPLDHQYQAEWDRVEQKRPDFNQDWQ
jgi:hypothetical protein